MIKGKYEKVGPDKIRITELPVGYWTENFKEHLEGLIEPGVDKDGKKIVSIVKDYDDMIPRSPEQVWIFGASQGHSMILQEYGSGKG